MGSRTERKPDVSSYASGSVDMKTYYSIGRRKPVSMLDR